MIQAEAYVVAGFHPNKGNAAALEMRQEIVDRISQIKASVVAKVEERTGVTLEKVVAELAKIGFSNMDDYVKRTPDGEIYVNLGDTTRDQMAAVQEITVDTIPGRGTIDGEDGEVEPAPDIKRTKFKLGDKRAALELLGKHLGAFPQQPMAQFNNTVNNVQVSVDERSTFESFLDSLSRRKGEKEVAGSVVTGNGSRAPLELEISGKTKTTGT